MSNIEDLRKFVQFRTKVNNELEKDDKCTEIMAFAIREIMEIDDDIKRDDFFREDYLRDILNIALENVVKENRAEGI